MNRRINWRVVLDNISEAREELEELEDLLRDPKRRSAGQLEVSLGHAYHHLNCAWRARFVSTERYRRCTSRDFASWSRFPSDVWIPGIEPHAKS